MTKLELQDENVMLRQKLEEIYDLIGELLGFHDREDDDESESDDES